MQLLKQRAREGDVEYFCNDYANGSAMAEDNGVFADLLRLNNFPGVAHSIAKSL